MSKTDLFTATMARENLKHDIDNEVYGLISFNPPAMDEEERAPLDLAIALDRSSSMGNNNKMELAKRSLLKLVDHLKAGDRLSLVTFDSQVETVFEPVLMTAENKKKAVERIQAVKPRGCTNLSGGLLTALGCLSDQKPKGTVRRCLLFTDGQANEGIRNAEGILTAASKTRGTTPISTFGYGTDCNSDLLNQLAVDGGNYHYIDTPDKILSAFGVELGGLISTYGQNVQVTLAPSKGVRILGVLNDLAVSENADGSVSIVCDDLLAEQPCHLVVQLKVDARDNAHPRAVTLMKATAKLYDVANTTPVELTASMKATFVKDGKADTTDNPVVMEEVALQNLVAAQAEAILKANAGDFAGAQHVMLNAAAQARGVGTMMAFKLGDAAEGMAHEYFGDHNSYAVAGGAQRASATRRVMKSRTGGSAGLNAGGVQMDTLYSNTAQTGTRAAFEEKWTPVQEVVPTGDVQDLSQFVQHNVVLPAPVVWEGPVSSPASNDKPPAQKPLTKSRSDRW